MKKIAGVKVPRISVKAPKESMPKAPRKQPKQQNFAPEDTLAAAMKKVQKRAKPKAGKITSF